MKITNLKIDASKTLNGKTLLTDVIPVYRYDHGIRTSEIEAYRYEVALPGQGFDKLHVKIEGGQKMEKPDGYKEVAFEGLELFFYWRNGTYEVGATAKDIREVSAAKVNQG